MREDHLSGSTPTPVLVLSSGRTGTMFLARLLGQLFPHSVASYHERGASRPLQIVTNLHLAGLLPRSVVTGTWHVLKRHELARCEHQFHVDVNPFLYGIPRIAPHLYPGLRVVHLIRDPREYVTSHLNFALHRPTSFIANYLIPFWQPSPVLTGAVSLRAYLSWSRLRRYAWIWDFKNAVIDSIETLDIPYLCIRFEDLVAPASIEATIGRIADFLGLPPAPAVASLLPRPLNEAPRAHFPPWPRWSPIQCAELYEICGPRMQKHRYGLEPLWKERLQSAA